MGGCMPTLRLGDLASAGAVRLGLVGVHAGRGRTSWRSVAAVCSVATIRRSVCRADGRFGKGRVVLLSPHFESTAGEPSLSKAPGQVELRRVLQRAAVAPLGRF